MTRPAEARVLVTNRRALREYEILQRVEAGIELRGPEVKSIREGRVSLAEGYADVEDGEVWLRDVHVQPYAAARAEAQDPTRPRRLLLHRHEIARLAGHVARRGCTLIPLRLLLRRGFIKVELGLARGRTQVDRREELRKRAAEREAQREARRRPQ